MMKRELKNGKQGGKNLTLCFKHSAFPLHWSINLSESQIPSQLEALTTFLTFFRIFISSVRRKHVNVLSSIKRKNKPVFIYVVPLWPRDWRTRFQSICFIHWLINSFGLVWWQLGIRKLFDSENSKWVGSYLVGQADRKHDLKCNEIFRNNCTGKKMISEYLGKRDRPRINEPGSLSSL